MRDDGDGMSLEEFRRVVSGGIGDSGKRAAGRPLIGGREVIGRLGIGMLGVSQISQEFSITSHDRCSRDCVSSVCSDERLSGRSA